MRTDQSLPLMRILIGTVCLAGLFAYLAWQGRELRDPRPAVLSGSTMGTIYTVRLAGLADVSAEQVQAEIDRRLELVNEQMSTWRPDSELSRFNAHEGTDWFEVSPATAAVVAEALRVSRMTDGAFDATVGPLVNLWNFGPTPRTSEPPSDEAVIRARAAVGYEHLEVRESPPALRKARSDLYVDLSGIAKGYGVDVVAEYLEGLDVLGYMVEIGGEVRTGGTKADGSPWMIGIESPGAGNGADWLDRRRVHRAVPLAGRALATSGDYRNVFESDGRRFSHTIDPRTGRPVEHALASASVVADNCMFADAAATALMVLGPDKAYNWAVSEGLAVLLIARNDDGTFVERTTPAFDDLLE